MPTANRTVAIKHPIEEVFAFIADGEQCPRWRSGVLDIKRVSGEGVGTRYAQGVRGPMGRRIAADYEITAYEPNRWIEFQATAGPVRPHGRYDFDAAEGGTRPRTGGIWPHFGAILLRRYAPLAMTHTVEFLWFSGCPSHAPARALLDEVIAAVAPGTVVIEIDASDPEVAAAHRFAGSPTIRVDGRDIDPGFVDPGDYTPRCRLFRTKQGLAGVPERRWIEEALR